MPIAMNWMIVIIDLVFFTCIFFTVIYLLVFALASTRKNKRIYPESIYKHHFAVIFPAYKEDKVISESVSVFLDQNYPPDKFDIIVVSDKMKDETNLALSKLPVTLLTVAFENSSKAKALNFAIDRIDEKKYDAVVILDADNMVGKNYLCEINNAFARPYKAIQTHRKAKNANTDTAILDSVSEEINNSIFRSGHVQLGLSAALIGSGMVLDFQWFKKNIRKVFSVGEDKEIESLLLEQRIHIEYLDNVYVYDEKIQKENAFRLQRLRWLTAQIDSFLRMCKQLPRALYQKNIDFCDKVFQMVMLPRSIILLIILFFSILTSLLSPSYSIKWWTLLLAFLFTLYLAIPSYLLNKKLLKASWKIPVLGAMMLYNLFFVKGAGKQFIHTNHGEK